MKYDQNQFWIARQVWEDVLFLHIPVPYESIHAYIPKPLQLETYHNQAWLSFVFLKSKTSQLRGIPVSYPSFFQLNVRTYVSCNGNSGIYFLSIDTNHLPVVLGGKWLSMPQYLAEVYIKTQHDGVYFSSNRIDSKAELSVHYSPFINRLSTQHLSLTNWLTERYLMWFIMGDKIVRGTVSHDPWIIKEAKLHAFKLKGFLPSLSKIEIEEPLIHYSERKQAYVHPFKIDGIYQLRET